MYSLHTLRRVMEFCDGWFPRGGGFGDPEAEMAKLRDAAEEAGRDIATVSITLFGAPPEAAYLDRCRAAGIDRVLLALPPEGRDKVMPATDEYATFLE